MIVKKVSRLFLLIFLLDLKILINSKMLSLYQEVKDRTNNCVLKNKYIIYDLDQAQVNYLNKYLSK